MNITKALEYRQLYREQHIGRFYNGYAHFAFTLALSIAAILFCINNIEQVTVYEWVTIPFTFLYANLAEYFGHKGPMHHPTKGLKLVFARHTEQHHLFFSHDNMAFAGHRDLHAVLFPPIMIIFFMGVFAFPVGLLLSWVASPNVGYLFVATGVAYFLNYEIFHWIYHLPEASWVYRIPGMKTLRRLHLDHHRTDWMSHYNFNISYPVGDWLFGTLRFSEKEK